KLCDRALWLRGGRTAALGAVDEVIDAYLEYSRERDRQDDVERREAPAGGGVVVRITEVALEGGEGEEPQTWRSGAPMTIRVTVHRSPSSDVEPGVGVAFVRNDGLVCYCVSTEMDGVAMERGADGTTFRAVLHVPELPLLGGGYYLNVATTNN